MKFGKLTFLFAAAMSVASCQCSSSHKEADSPKYLVLYYSQTGATRNVAEAISEMLGADIEAFDVETPYDGTYGETIARVQGERAENYVPALVPLTSKLDEYDVIFLGYPIWFGTYAPPVASLLKDVDLSGKTIVPFCSFGSGGLEASVADLAKAVPGASFADGYGVRNARIASAPKEVKRFLIENGYLEGDVEALAEYSEQQPVTETEVEIFNKACGDYQFPLGTPVTFGTREGDGSLDYKFAVKTATPDGSEVLGTIYVTVVEGAEPEFTRVVR